MAAKRSPGWGVYVAFVRYHRFAIDREGSLAALADTAAVVREVEHDGVLARRELLMAMRVLDFFCSGCLSPS